MAPENAALACALALAIVSSRVLPAHGRVCNLGQYLTRTLGTCTGTCSKLTQCTKDEWQKKAPDAMTECLNTRVVQ